MKRYIVFLVLGVFLLATNVNAWECEYGEAKAWVKLSNDTQWREAMVDGVTLKVREPFKVKVWVKTKTECYVDIELYDPGITKVFEVVEGPSKNGEMIYSDNCPANWTKTYEWTVRPTGEWTEGWAPLNILVQFTQDPTGYTNKIDKTIIHAYISSEEWKENENTDGESQGGHHTPGFEFFVVMAAIAMIVWRRWKIG